jgi:hypothetical protein
MYARVATFEGGDPAKVRETIAQINERAAEEGPPEGVPSTGLMILSKPEDGKVIAIGLFETEENLRKGHETLSAMDPPVAGGMGNRVSVEMFEVPVKIDVA